MPEPAIDSLAAKWGSPKRTPILRPLLIRPDQRGSVREAYRASWFPQIPPVVQIVHSESDKDVMRAMHLHLVQYDIWHLTRGRAFVQTYDPESSEHFAFEMDAGATLVIPPGVGHGFLALEDLTLTYYLTREYDGTDEYEFAAYGEGFPGAGIWPLHVAFVRRSRRDEISASLADSLEANVW